MSFAVESHSGRSTSLSLYSLFDSLVNLEVADCYVLLNNSFGELLLQGGIQQLTYCGYSLMDMLQ